MYVCECLWRARTRVCVHGRPSPLRQWRISSCFRFPLFLNFFDSVENFPNFTFSRKIFRFSSAKISDDIFFINHNFRISPLFSLFQYISPLFRQIILFPYFKNFSPCFRQIYVFFTYFMCFSFSPYFYHDAFMHQPMHVGLLDATVCVCLSVFPVSTGIWPQSLPEWAFRGRPGLWRICLCPKVSQIAEQKFGSR